MKAVVHLPTKNNELIFNVTRKAMESNPILFYCADNMEDLNANMMTNEVAFLEKSKGIEMYRKCYNGELKRILFLEKRFIS